MDARDLILACGEGLDRRSGPPAQDHAPLDHLARISARGRQVPLAFRRLPVYGRLVPGATRLRSLQRRLLAVKALGTQSHESSGALDRLQSALMQGLSANASVFLTLSNLKLAPIGQTLALVGPALPLVSLVLPLIGQCLALVSIAFPVICHTLPLVSLAFLLIGATVADALTAHILAHSLLLVLS